MKGWSTRRGVVGLAMAGAGVMAMWSVAWACTIHFGTLAVCAAPSTVNTADRLGAGCTAQEGDYTMRLEPGYPTNDITKGVTSKTTQVEPGGTLLIVGSMLPQAAGMEANSPAYTLKYLQSTSHTDCHDATEIPLDAPHPWGSPDASPPTWYTVGEADTGQFAVLRTVPLNATPGSMAWVCVQGGTDPVTWQDLGNAAPLTIL